MCTKILVPLLAAVFVACNPPTTETKEVEQKKPLTQKPAATQPVIDADTYFSQRCVACHGADGKGDGPAAAALNPKPRAYTDAAWQASVSDEELRKVILEGGAATGKSPLMPASPDLQDEPELVDGLVKKVRGFAKSN